METRNTGVRSYTITVPISDMSLFRAMTKRMGWHTVCVKTKKNPHLDAETWLAHGLSQEAAESCARSMRDYEAGRYEKCSTPEQLNDFLASL